MFFTLQRLLQLVLITGLSTGLASKAALAQVSLGDPSPGKIKSCDDFATQEFADPWDMSNTADINNFFPERDVIDFISHGFGGGRFTGVTSGANNTLYLFSPVVIGSHAAGGRYGETLNLDPTKFTHLSIRMKNDKVDPHGMLVMFDRGRNYATQRSVSEADAIPTKTGWNTYTINLPALPLSSAGDTRSWTAGSITGLALRPTTQSGASIELDWVRLEDPSSCSSSSSSISYSANASGGNEYFNLYLDDDQDPFNGFAKQLVADQLATGNGTASLSSPLGMAPGTYYPVALLSSDYATLKKNDPWDFSGPSDLLNAGDISNPRFEGGAYKGTTTSSDSAVYLKLGAAISASRFKKLSLKLSRPAGAGNFFLIWVSGGIPSIKTVTAAHHIGGDVYQVDLGQEASWNGSIDTLIVRPAGGANVEFSLDWVSLRSQGFVTSLSTDELAGTTTKSAQPLVINAPPLATLTEPNNKGGVALKAWNMNSGDFVNYGNLTGGADAAHPGETSTTFLPDVRLVDGLRGDFFKGTNVAPSDDPVQYSTFPHTPNELTFDANEYRNICFKMFIDVPFILTDLDGSMARVVWKKLGSETYESTGAFVAIYDGWSGTKWYEYCDDLKTLEPEPMLGTWDGQIQEFRVDSHEIRHAAPYYYDYIKLRKDDSSTNGKFVIPYNLSDADDNATLSLYYTPTKSTTGGTLIAGGLTKSSRHYEWDTTTVPNGTYYVYSVATDSRNTTTTLASGRIVINNGGATATSAPVLSVAAPQNSDVICDTLQVKGYALQSDRLEDVASVEVLVDGAIIDVVHPSLFSSAAKNAYPSADSSNSGFERTYAFSGYSAGAHTVSIRARSTDGGVTTEDISVTKGTGSCTALRADPNPAGSPIAVDTGITVPGTPPGGTPTPQPRVLQPPTISGAGISKAGVFQATISSLTDATVGCRVGLYLGTKKSSANVLVKRFSISPTRAAGGMKLKATGIKVNRRKLKSVYLKAVKSCGADTATSGVVAAKIGTSAGAITSLSQLKGQLAKKLK